MPNNGWPIAVGLICTVAVIAVAAVLLRDAAEGLVQRWDRQVKR